MKNNKKGFTLIELLVVIAIIGILASVVLASLNSARKKSRDARRVADIKQIQLALEMYYDANSGKYPLGTQTGTGTGSYGSLAPTYIPVIPVDPLGTGSNIYSYQSTDGAATPAACSAAPCYGYVLKALLEETTNAALASSLTGTVAGVVCNDATTRNGNYCVKP
ncbi:MAG: type II secretion system protein [Candidatus Niyogibacteria bacterium]|nr:type II secretion system protein [Candidatus Niyogibacteria bacterium]